MRDRNQALIACVLPAFFLAACASLPPSEQSPRNLASDPYTGVADLINDYGFLADARDAEAVASLFAEGGALTIPAANVSVIGPTDIEGVYAATWAGLAGTLVKRRHIISGLRLTDVTPDGANFRAIMNVTERSEAPQPQLHLTGYYTGKAVQTAAGWKLEQLVINIDR
jgi:hypothetical protein